MILIKNRYLRLARALAVAMRRTAMVVGTASFALVAVAGCGQKGDLYLVDNSPAATVQPASAAIDSGSQPQDSAFARLQDNEFDSLPPETTD